MASVLARFDLLFVLICFVDAQELKAESRNVELNRRLFHACEQSFSDTCPSIAGIVEVEAGAITDDQSEKLLECMLDNREV